jgi:hypothetical protein
MGCVAPGGGGELPTQHLNLVTAFNERSRRIRKQALLEIQIGGSAVDQVVLLSPQLLTDAILGRDFLVDHAAEISFPDRTISLKINHLTPNGHFSGRTAGLTSRRCILYRV